MARSITAGVCRGFVVLATLAIVACATQGAKIRSNRDAAVDFSQYRSFAFVSPLGTDRANYESLVSRALKAAARQELEARGLVRLRYGEIEIVETWSPDGSTRFASARFVTPGWFRRRMERGWSYWSAMFGGSSSAR